MNKIIADRMLVDDDELHFRDADAQNKLKNLIVQGKGDSETAVMSQAAATVEFDKLSGDIADVNESLNQPLDVEFSVGAGFEHSSKIDQITVTCKKDQKYYVTVKTSTESSAVLGVYEYSNGVGNLAHQIKPNVENECVALTDFDALGLYVGKSEKDCTYKFKCETEDTISGTRCVSFKNDVNSKLGKIVIPVSIRDVEQGSCENGVSSPWETLRIKTKKSYKVEKGSVLSFVPNGLYAHVQVYAKEVTGESQTVLETSGWIGGDIETEYKIANSGYMVILFANGKDYMQSKSITVKDYVSETLIYNNIYFHEDAAEVIVKDIPDYWSEHLTDRMVSVNNNTSSCAMHGDSFIFFTDYHLETSSGYSHLLMRDIVNQASVDKVVFGGDIFNGSETHDGAMEKINEYLKRFKPLNVYGVRGNHEYNWNDGGSIAEQLSDSEIYNVLLKGVERNVKTNGDLSCYLDNENQKIRYILMDSHYETDNDIIPQSECEWLQERMLELESDWTVVVFTHIMFSMTYAGSQSGSVSYYTNGQRIVDAINDIKDEMKATLACVICGHVHYDYSNTDNGYLIITTTCDSKQDSGQWIGWGQGGGTIKEHAFDVFSIDTVNRTIKTVRVGRGEDREWNY